MLIWAFGCESTVVSMMDPTKKITRAELELESDYLIGRLKCKLNELDKQDEIKQLMIDQANIFATTGTFNPTGLLNTGISIAAIAFGLDRNRKLKIAVKEKTNSAT